MIVPTAMLAVGTALTGIQSTFALVDASSLCASRIRLSASSTADDECPVGRSSNVVNDLSRSVEPETDSSVAVRVGAVAARAHVARTRVSDRVTLGGLTQFTAGAVHCSL